MAKQEKEEKDSTSPAYASRSQDSLSSKEDSPEPTKTFEEADDSELAKVGGIVCLKQVAEGIFRHSALGVSCQKQECLPRMWLKASWQEEF